MVWRGGGSDWRRRPPFWRQDALEASARAPTRPAAWDQELLGDRAPATPTAPVVGDDGVERTHARVGARRLETVLGRVEVVCEGRGARGRATRFPLDAELNLPPELCSFGCRRRAATGTPIGGTMSSRSMRATTPPSTETATLPSIHGSGTE